MNKVRCKKCNDIIESTTTHDFKWCKCGNVAVDGGPSYLRRVGNLWEEGHHGEEEFKTYQELDT